MKKSAKLLVILFLIATLSLTACGAPEAAPVEEAAPAEEEAPAEEAAPTGKVCIALDSGGVDDKGYNLSAWEGGQQAAAELGWDAVYLVANQQAD
ncbi:BMP family ABC transporter substrate-binding protein, partial [bacterium]|nr:BMP family ABC transporter substrate-binding protein [bacterium]